MHGPACAELTDAVGGAIDAGRPPWAINFMSQTHAIVANQAFVLILGAGRGACKYLQQKFVRSPGLRRSIGPGADYHLPQPRALVAMSLAISPTRSKRSARSPEPAASNRHWPKSLPNAPTLVCVSSSDKQPNVVVAAAGGANALAAFKSFLVLPPADTGIVPLQHLAQPHPIALTEKLARVTKMPLMEFRDPTVEPSSAIE